MISFFYLVHIRSFMIVNSIILKSLYQIHKAVQVQFLPGDLTFHHIFNMKHTWSTSCVTCVMLNRYPTQTLSTSSQYLSLINKHLSTHTYLKLHAVKQFESCFPFYFKSSFPRSSHHTLRGKHNIACRHTVYGRWLTPITAKQPLPAQIAHALNRTWANGRVSPERPIFKVKTRAIFVLVWHDVLLASEC